MRLKRLQSIILASLLSTPLFAGFEAMNPLQSTTHTANTASSNTQIALSWNQAIATDNDNLGGYYYILDQNETTLIPTVVDTRSTLGVSATSITVTASNEGTFYFHLAPYADSGNIGATLHFKFIKIDTSAPTSFGISPDGGSFNSVQTISMSATDVNNYTIYYTTDNSNPTQNNGTVYSAPFTLSSSKTIKAVAIDSAGNSTPIASSAFTITNTANVAQFGNEVTAGSTIATTNSGGSANFVPSISIEGASVTEYKFKIDTANYSAQIAKATPIEISSLQDGVHTISILGYDGTSLQLESEATTLSFTVDNTAPDNVAFSTPSGTEITSDATITMSSTDSSIYYTTDGSVPDQTSTQASSISLNSSNNGTFTLRAISYDTAGNKSSVQQTIYTVNIIAPTNGGNNSSSNNGGASSGGTVTPPNNDDNNNATDNTDNNIPTDDNNATENTDNNIPTYDNNATDNTDNNITIDDNNATDNTDNNIPTDDNNATDNTDNNITIDDNNATDNTDNNITIDDNNATDNTDNNIPTDDNNDATDPIDDDSTSGGDSTSDGGSTSGGGSNASINLPFINDNGSKESVNINSDVKNTIQITNSDGSVTVTASTKNVKNELQVNTDGTLNSATTIGSATSNIEVNTVGADTQFNADGSLTISSTISDTVGSSISSNVEVKANGEMTNTLNITVKDGASTQSVIKSDIAGTDTVIGNDGSMTMTTPTITTAKNQKVDFEIVLSASGEIAPTLSVDGTDIPLPQFEAGSTVSIKKELNKILLTIETLLTQKLTFN